jgi:hypothetical protein
MDITAICVVGFIVLGIYKLFELFVKRKERMTIIEKLPALLNMNESGGAINLPAITFGRQDSGSWPLRISLLLIGIGLGCVIAFFIQYGMIDSFTGRDFDNWNVRHQIEQTQSILYFAFITIFGGLGLFIAYMIEKKSK